MIFKFQIRIHLDKIERKNIIQQCNFNIYLN